MDELSRKLQIALSGQDDSNKYLELRLNRVNQELRESEDRRLKGQSQFLNTIDSMNERHGRTISEMSSKLVAVTSQPLATSTIPPSKDSTAALSAPPGLPLPKVKTLKDLPTAS